MPNGHQNDQPKGTPDAMYVVVDKSKKHKGEKTQGGASAIPLHRELTEKSSTMNGAVSLGRIGSGTQWERS